MLLADPRILTLEQAIERSYSWQPRFWVVLQAIIQPFTRGLSAGLQQPQTPPKSVLFLNKLVCNPATGGETLAPMKPPGSWPAAGRETRVSPTESAV